MRNSSIKIIPPQYTTKILKGTALIEETTLLFAHGDINQSIEKNLTNIRDFGVLKGGSKKEFSSIFLPNEAFAFIA